MKVFIKGKEVADWKQLDFEEYDNNHFKIRVATYYINNGYDVKVEQ